MRASFLQIDIGSIPSEGLDVGAALDAALVHVDGEPSFELRAGGRLDCRLERGDDHSVHVRGRLSATLGLECGRCLDPWGLAVEQQLDLFYLRHQAGVDDESEDEVELSDRDMVVAYYRGERLDLGEMLREQLFLAIPMQRVCRAECRGLCLRCGANRNRQACDCPPAEPDPRLAVLETLFDKGAS